MLLVERRRGESVWIGDFVQVEVREIGHKAIQLGIRAPRDVLILRDNVSQRTARTRWREEGSAPYMLFVRRHAGESLSIGPEIELTALRIHGSHVTLAIRAPQSMRIRRSDSRAGLQ